MSLSKKVSLYLGILIAIVSCQTKPEIPLKSSVVKINEDWKFFEGEAPKATNKLFDDSAWETVTLPHDWSISKPFSKDNPSFSRGAWLPAGVSYYRKKLALSQVGVHQKVFVRFEGAYRNAEVWINGNYLGKRPSGYTTFEYEITPHIALTNENILTVKLDNSAQPGSRWYSGNGIYRDVFLVTKNEVHLPTWQTYVTTPKVTQNSAEVEVKTQVKNTTQTTKIVTVEATIYDQNEAEVTKNTKQIEVLPNATATVKIPLTIAEPKLWSVKKPHLYQVKVAVVEGTHVLDSEIVSTGIRTMEYTVENGFVLNGTPTKIKGVCLHHGAGPLGAAARVTSYERQIRILKEMGANAVRTAHNPFDPEFLEVCDKMGMLVMNEAFDEWEVVKKPATFREKGEKIRIPVKYYAHLFKEWSTKDLTDFVLRDRNHPSIFMWSIGNEIDQMHDESGAAIAKRLQDIVHQYDYRPATCGVNGYGWDEWPNEASVSVMDIKGYNYADAEDYDLEHKNFPNRKMIITEHTSAQLIANRGEYYPFKKGLQSLQLDLPTDHIDTQKFLKGRKYFSKGKIAWLGAKSRPYVMGEFIWTGWDYLGEVIPYAWPARSSTFGVIDLAGFPKDGYYYYQSQWANKPVTHVFPHWNWKGHEGETLLINAFSNAEEVELFVNGKSQGKKKNDLDSFETLTWKVVYEPGEIKAVGFTNGVKTSEAISVTAIEKVHQLQLKVTDQSEITYVEVAVFDEKNNFIPTANTLLHFEVENAKIIGVGNGNNKSHEPFVANYRKVYHGKCVVILEKIDQTKDAKLMATAAGIKNTTVSF